MTIATDSPHSIGDTNDVATDTIFDADVVDIIAVVASDIDATNTIVAIDAVVTHKVFGPDVV